MQRRELRQTRKEFHTQNETLKQERFEDTFFRLISSLNDIIKSIDLKADRSIAIIATGRDCFKVIYKKLLKDVRDLQEKTYRKQSGYTKEITEAIRFEIQETILNDQV